MTFDEWFKNKFKDLHESICYGDLVAKLSQSNQKRKIK